MFSSHSQQNHYNCSLRGKTLVRPVRQAEPTHTSPTGGQFVAWRALATVTAWYVDTVGITLAQVVPTVALIDVCVGGRKRGTEDISDRLYNCLVRAACGQQERKHNNAILALPQLIEGPGSCSHSESLYEDPSQLSGLLVKMPFGQ